MIPNIFHFNFGLSPDFGGKPFSMIHYLGIRSAYEINKPDVINMWYEYEPDTVWWERIKPYVTFNKIKAPTRVSGKPLNHPAHRSDVQRLRTLLREGGIYLDCDTICVRPFTDLRKRDFVMGIQHNRGLANAAILAKPNAGFAQLWLDSYSTFRSKRRFDRYWDEHSVIIPHKLAKKFPHLIHVLDEKAFFHPLWGEMPEFVYGPDRNVSEMAYSVHLWEQLTWQLFVRLSPEQVIASKSEFARLTKPYLQEFMKTT